ncbi:MAG: carbon-nitrogen family hydrolase [Saprospiraceae bacterium]|nr:carbon-nitrogen family hydrolase [Saprospiraceae bacterium]
MKIAAVQIDCQAGNTKYNLQKITSMVAQAKRQGADLVVLPELVDTGYVMSEMHKCTIAPHAELTMQALTNAAKENDIYVIAGIAEVTDEGLHNTAVILDPSGRLITKYRKTHLYFPSGEGVFNAGDELVTIGIGGFTVGLMICYDTRFPEVARGLALQGADLIIVPTAWPFPRVEHWQILTRARAIENQCYLVGANRVGIDGAAIFCGNSRIIDPHGVVIASAAEDQEEIIYADISHEKVEFIRNRMPVFEHRRPDVYSTVEKKLDR